jgi:hypothetical protein
MSARSLPATILALPGLVALTFALTTAPALAAALETPVTEAATSVTATGATLHGVLNPLVEAPTPGYQFTYNTNGSCTEGPATEPVAEAPEVLVAGLAVSAQLSELEPSREYTFCVVASRTPEGEPTETVSGAAEHFTTLPEAPKVDGESVSALTAFGATLEAQVNPDNQETNYFFQYSTEAHGETLEGEVTTLPGAGPLGAEFGDRTASAATGAVLRAGVSYYYRVLTENTSRELSEGKLEQFTTPGTPVVSAGEASSVTRTSALIGGEVDASGARTEYFVEYGVGGAQGALGSPTSVAVLEAEPAGPQKIGPVALEELRPGTTYSYRIVTVNEAGTTDGAEGSFTTAPAQPPSAVTGEALEVTQTAATIIGAIDPNGLPTSYVFEIGNEVNNGVPAYSSPSYGEAGSEATAQPERLSLANLLPGTTYHYRIVATNVDGTSHGEDHTFTTLGFASPLVTPTSPELLALTHLSEPSVSVVTSKTKPLTRAQKFAKALKACHAKRGRKRSGCEAAARGKYGSAKRRGK